MRGNGHCSQLKTVYLLLFMKKTKMIKLFEVNIGKKRMDKNDL